MLISAREEILKHSYRKQKYIDCPFCGGSAIFSHEETNQWAVDEGSWLESSYDIYDCQDCGREVKK